MRDNEGKWVVVELEAIEPSLFFRHNHGSGRMLADEVIRSLNGEVENKPDNLKYQIPRTSDWKMRLVFVLTQIFMLYINYPNQLVLSMLTLSCYYWASTCDSGFVKPWHFRDDNKVYYIEGRVGEKEEDHGQIKHAQTGKLVFASEVECPLCHTIKV